VLPDEQNRLVWGTQVIIWSTRHPIYYLATRRSASRNGSGVPNNNSESPTAIYLISFLRGMTDNGKPYRNSCLRLIIGAPLTFALFFTVGIALDWRMPFASNLASALLDAMFFTIAFAVLDRVFPSPR
jgi:hypothetical protein